MSFNKYYQEELGALLEMGREFAEANPMLAPFLSTPGKDPDVERLMEGFAFLTGRLRQKLDDELPEITHSLFNLLWPNYLRPLPSCSIVQYSPTEKLSGSTFVPRGTTVNSIPVEGTSCTFRTVYDVDVLPFELAEQAISERDGYSILGLRFALTSGNLGTLPLKTLSFYCSGEPGTAFSLYFALLSKVSEIRFVVRNSHTKEDTVTAVLPPKSIRSMGFGEDEPLFPYPSNTFPGYRLLQEYFCFTEKFLFLELSGLEKGLPRDFDPILAEEHEFELQFIFKSLPEKAESFRKENFRIFSTPVVNLFNMDSAPLGIDHCQTDYRIVPDPGKPYHYACFSVDSVSTWHHYCKGRREYHPFESFDYSTKAGDKAFYRLRMRPSMHDSATETYISIIYLNSPEVLPEPETISLELTCTNRMLPAQLSVGDICIHAEDTPDNLSFRNITGVTPSYAPPLEGDLLWQLISNMSLNYISLIDTNALRSVLRAYDFRSLHDKQRGKVLQRILSGMVDISCKFTDRIYNSLPLRGTKTRLVLNQRCFSCEGDMWLFASVINEFLALYATVNSFHQLEVLEEKNGEAYIWPARLGSMEI